MYVDAQRGVTVILADDWDNESFYGECDYMSCSEKDGLVRRALFWIKVALIKVANSYVAFPIILFTLPLLAGLVLGYFLGSKKHHACNQETRRDRTLWFTSFESFLYFAFKWSPTCKQQPSIDSRNEDLTEMKAVLSPKNDHTSSMGFVTTSVDDTPGLVQREDETRKMLLESEGMINAQIPKEALPRHVAVVMDGNRRYGRAKYGNTTAGHWDGCRKLLDMATWCQSLRIPSLTVYAFSTENWNRTEAEVSALFAIFCRYADELRKESIKRKFAVKVLSTDHVHRIPHLAQQALKRLEDETRCFIEDGNLQINVCLSYGSRGEIINACRSLAKKCIIESHDPDQYITDSSISEAMLTDSDPDILIRTSGEVRLSNFLLWQLAYTELFFVDKMWPDLEKDDFLDILHSYAKGRQRRYGK
jgi:undecaprenyl diphosphate synthase